MSDDVEVPRNGYEFPFYPNELLGHNSISDILNVSSKIFNKLINEQSARWTGAFDLPLYDHQRAVIQGMLDREAALRRGIEGEDNDIFFSQFAFLGDYISTGKTWAALAYIEAAKTLQRSTLYLNQMSQINCFSIKAKLASSSRQTNLVIAPLHICNAWAELLRRQTQLSHLIVRRKNFITADDIIERIESVDVVVVPNTLYAELNHRLQQENFIWTRVFIDDWTGIPLTQTRATINAEFTWILTSAWYHFLFEDNYHNLWYWQRLISMIPEDAGPDLRLFLSRIMDRPADIFASPGTRSLFTRFITNHPSRHHLIVRTEDQFIKKSILPQDPEIVNVSYTGDKVMQFLYSLAGRGVRPHLDQSRFREALELVGATIHGTDDWVNIKNGVLRHESEDDCCPICFEAPSIPVLTNCCQKFFCSACLFRSCQVAGNQTCPTCRGHIRGQQLIAIHDAELVPQQYPLKVDALIATIRPDEQTLIYFPAEPFYGLLRSHLRAADLNFDVLSGSKYTIKQKIDKFIAGKINILIFFNCNQIINAEFPNVQSVVFYPDEISQTDKTRILVKTQCIGRSERLRIIQFKDMRTMEHMHPMDASQSPDQQT